MTLDELFDKDRLTVQEMAWVTGLNRQTFMRLQYHNKMIVKERYNRDYSDFECHVYYKNTSDQPQCMYVKQGIYTTHKSSNGNI